MENNAAPKVISAVFMLVLICSVAAGSIYMMQRSGGYSGLNEYLTSYFKNTLGQVDKYGVFKNALRSNLIMLAVIFVSGFFRIGFLAAGAYIVRRGFIIGFTSAAFVSCFGVKGMLASLSFLPGLLLIIPAFMCFCTASGSFSLKKDRFRKKIIFSYIFFTIFAITIFCTAAFLEGYLTTTFMTKFAAML
ncbi:MAG: stage II sporulation protein M [Clostridia bacterium]|nr:stage II sporulation protein M [Clostridia bacterium]